MSSWALLGDLLNFSKEQNLVSAIVYKWYIDHQWLLLVCLVCFSSGN